MAETYDDINLYMWDLIDYNDTNEALALIASGKLNLSFVHPCIKKTLLMHACNINREQIALALIATGKSNPSYKSIPMNETALIYACDEGNVKLALALIATGESDPGCVDRNHESALYNALSNKNAEIIFALEAVLTADEIQFARKRFEDVNGCMRTFGTNIKSVKTTPIECNDSDATELLRNNTWGYPTCDNTDNGDY